MILYPTNNDFQIGHELYVRDVTPQYNNKWFSDSKADCTLCPKNTWSGTPGITSPYECTKCELGTFSDIKGASDIKTCKHCPAGTYFKEPEDSLLVYEPDVVCHSCPAGSWSSGVDGICHLCPIGYWAGLERRKKPCDEICEKNYLCPVGSVDARMFTLPQGNDLPVLEYPFWVGSSLCFTVAFTVLLFRVA